MQQAHERGDLATVIVRPPWFYGPYQPARQTPVLRAPSAGAASRWSATAPSGGRWSTPATSCTACCGPRWPTTAPGNAYWIADAEPYELREILATVRRALDGRGAARVAARQPRLPRLGRRRSPRRLDAAAPGPRAATSRPLHVLGELKDTIACDISRARDELGYEPDRSALLEGMRASIRWCLERGEQL